MEKKIDLLLSSSATRDYESDRDSMTITPEQRKFIKQWFDDKVWRARTEIVVKQNPFEHVLVRIFLPDLNVGNNWVLYIANRNNKKVHQGFATLNENGADVILGSIALPSDDEGQSPKTSDHGFHMRADDEASHHELS